MKKHNRRRKLGNKVHSVRRRRSFLESLEDRRLLAGDFEDVIIGVGNLPRRDTEIDAQIVINEIEQDNDPSDDPITNDTIATAQAIPLGFDLGEYQAIDIRGELNDASVTTQLNKELTPIDPNNPLTPEQRDDSSFRNANIANSNGLSRFDGFIGDSPLGNNSLNSQAVGGDGDYYRLSNIDAGQFVTAHVEDNGLTALVLYDEFGRVMQSSESNPTVSNFISHEVHEDGTYYFAVLPFEDVSTFEFPRDPTNPDQVFGGPTDTYTITISVDASADIDFYSMELMPGDILGINGLGSADTVSLRNPEGDLILQSSEDRSDIYPLANPLPGGGNSSLGFVISKPGTYYVGVQAHQTYNRYLLEARVFRPAIESEPVGSEQILFLDFDGATFNPQITFGPSFKSELSPLSKYISRWGLTRESELIDKIVAEVKADYNDLLAINPNMKLTILNSKDHADPFGKANVSRIIIGGDQAQLQINGIYGIAESIDVGNFDTTETGIVLLDTLSGPAVDPNSLNHYVIAPGAKKVDLVARGISRIVSHEAAHHFGAWHTEPLSKEENIIDSGGTRPFARSIGIGPDLIWGTADDTDPKFVEDVYSLAEGYVGIEDVAGMFAHVFVAGQGRNGPTAIPKASGTVFNDANGNGESDIGETGFGGIRVYADINGDKEFGISEPTAITGGDGRFSLDLGTASDAIEVRVATQTGQTVTAPADGGVTVGQIRSGSAVRFGVQSQTGDASGTDFGHAPLSYGPASHDIQGGVRLGATISGDDGSGEDANDDGVTITGLVAGGTATAKVTAIADGFAPALVNAWIDFNDNGRFESNERVLANQRINGSESISFSVPATATAGETWARFRMGYIRDIGPTGASGVGEVEDYVVTVRAAGGGNPGGGGGGGGDVGPQANADTIEVNAGATNVTLNVLANDSAGSEAVTIQQVSASTVGSSIRVSNDGLRLIYTPGAALTSSETFSYTIGNSIDTSTANVTVNLVGGVVDPGGDVIAVRVETTTTDGVPTSTIAVGDNFNVNVYLDDLRQVPQGVFAAYLDVVFDSDLASIDGVITFGDYFVDARNPVDGDVNNLPVPTDPGDVADDDLGGYGLDAPSETTNQLLLTIPMVATSAGVLELSTDGPDNLPFREILLYPFGSPDATDDRIDFGTASITITSDAVVENASPFTNPVNRYDVDNDGYVIPRDALVLITNINEYGARKLNPLVGAVSGPYLDVTGDGFLSPRDARDLIAEINRLSAAASAGEPDDDAVLAAAIDAAFSSDFDGDDEEFFDTF